jgi:D-alanine-D-alanine ligase
MNQQEFLVLKNAIEKKEKILVSGCLLGMKINYKEEGSLVQELLQLMLKGQAVAICPEVLGGLPTPRPCCEIRNVDGQQKVFNEKGEDVTETFKLGAERALDTAKVTGAKIAVMKSNSPSCGSGRIYDGTFTGKKIKGDGIAAALLKENGIIVITEDEFLECIQ